MPSKQTATSEITIATENPYAGTYLSWRAALLAGLLAGFVFLVLEIITAFLFGAHTPLGPSRVVLYSLIGAESLPEALDPGYAAASILLHFAISLFVVALLGLITHSFVEMYLSVVFGVLFGFTAYYFSTHVSEPVFPLFDGVRDVFLAINYMIFGVVAAWSYKRIQQRTALPEGEHTEGQT